MATPRKKKTGIPKKPATKKVVKKPKKTIKARVVKGSPSVQKKKADDVIVTLRDDTADEDKLIFYGLVVALIVTLVFAGYAVYKAQQPQPFSQVWLEEKTLPNAVTVGEVFSFQFTIDSHEIKDAKYSYVVTISSVKQVSGSIVLHPNEKKTMTAHMAILNETGFTDDSAKVMVVVTKQIPNEAPLDYSLWFWMDKR